MNNTASASSLESLQRWCWSDMYCSGKVFLERVLWNVFTKNRDHWHAYVRSSILKI